MGFQCDLMELLEALEVLAKSPIMATISESTGKPISKSAISALDDEFYSVKGSPVPLAASAFKKLKLAKTQVEFLKATIEKYLAYFSEILLPDMLTSDKISSVSMPIGTVYLRNKVHAYIKKEDKEKVFAWLEEHGHGDIIQQHIFPSTLDKFAKNADDLPEEINVNYSKKAYIRKNN